MEALKNISLFAIPTMLFIILCYGMHKKVPVYDVFLEGAKEGLDTVLKIMPTLVGLLVAIGVFKASGALDFIINIIKPAVSLVGLPPEILPLALLRPISGSGSLAILADMLKTYGPDSFIGKVASTMMGSTETIFYTLTVYFGSVGIKNIRYTLVAALIADVVSVIVSVWICKLL